MKTKLTYLILVGLMAMASLSSDAFAAPGVETPGGNQTEELVCSEITIAVMDDGVHVRCGGNDDDCDPAKGPCPK